LFIILVTNSPISSSWGRQLY